jgi:hypothetical protein
MPSRIALEMMLALACAPAWAIDSPFDATTRGTLCRPTSQGPLECSYSVGQDLAFTIAPVGQPDALVSFVRSNDGGDYYGAWGAAAGCVVVKHGRRGVRESGAPYAYAFVSPKNGRVYKDWHDCRKAAGEKK